MLIHEPVVESRIPHSLGTPSIFRAQKPAESVIRESPIREIPDAPDTEDQQQQQATSPIPPNATPIAPMSSTQHQNSTTFDFTGMMEARNSPLQETPLSAQFPLTHKIPWAAPDHNVRDECLDFLNFGSPTPEGRSIPVSFGTEQGGACRDDDLNTMDVDTFLELGNEMAEACSSVPLNTEYGRRYSGDNLNTMGVHTVMDFGEEMPLWSDFMLNEILSPISTHSGA